MKKILLFIFLPIVVLLTWYGESRHFLCLDDGRCVTVWKTYNNVCYIVPGKYYGITKPSGNYIQTTNRNAVTLLFSKKLPNALVYRKGYGLTTYNTPKKEFVFYDYESDTTKFSNLLFTSDRSDLQPDADEMMIEIHESYALNKRGEKM